MNGKSKRKYNTSNKSTPKLKQNSKIFDFCHEELKEITMGTDILLNDDLFKAAYVQRPDIQRKLSIPKEPSSNGYCMFLTGVTGSGKSCILHNMFRIGFKNRGITDKTLTLPITFNGFESEPERRYSSIQKHFVNTIIDRVEETLQSSAKFDVDEFYAFTKDLYPGYLACDQSLILGTSKDTNAIHSERLERFWLDHPLCYCSALLAYVYSNDNNVNNILLVVDDVEAVGFRNETLPIFFGTVLFHHLKTGISRKHLELRVNIVFGIRHYVYRMLSSRNIPKDIVNEHCISAATMESYWRGFLVDCDESPVTLMEIVNRRIDYLRKAGVKADKKKKAFEIASKGLNIIIKEYGELIRAINICDLRKSLETLCKVVSNFRYLDQEVRISKVGAFILEDIDALHFRNPNILRAIGLDERNVYIEYESEIKNLLGNDAFGDYSGILVLIILRYLFNIEHVSFGNSIKRMSVKRDVSCLLNNLIPEADIDDAITKLLLNRLLLRGLENAQDDAYVIDEETAKNADFIYLGYAARILYDLLAENSVLMEMYVDDVWVDNANSFYPPTDYEIFNQNSFVRCLDYLEEVVKVENNLLTVLKNVEGGRRIELYSQLIGTDLVSAHLHNGLTSSYSRYSGVYASSDIKSRIDGIANSIQILNKKIWGD